MSEPAPLFICDAMLGGLARWLRAAGYDASWTEGIDDGELVRLARRESRVLLSSDHGVFRFGAVRDGEVRALFVPIGRSPQELLALVLRELKLPLRPPRCMRCGGPLVQVPKEQARGRVPPGTFARRDEFYQCLRCGHFFWHGSHWPRIAAALQRAAGGEESVRPSPD
jgi:uncharacterized protein with PIN domain